MLNSTIDMRETALTFFEIGVKQSLLLDAARQVLACPDIVKAGHKSKDANKALLKLQNALAKALEPL